MQVTDEMFYAAMDALSASESGWLPPSGIVLRQMLQAALDVAGNVDLPVTATVHVQIDEAAFKASMIEAVEGLHAGLPRDRDGRITIATLRGEAATSQHQIPVTEPRPGSTIDDIAAVIGHHRQVVLEWIADRNLGRSRLRFPEPVVTTGDVERDLYDLDAVKAWYDALPQATDG